LQRVHEHGVGLDYVVLAAVTVMTTTVRVSRGVGFVRRDFDSGARGRTTRLLIGRSVVVLITLPCVMLAPYGL
jgi:hypothetical protein